MKLELMQGIKALDGGEAKYAEISSMCLANEHVVARALQQNENLTGAEKWQEVHSSLLQLKEHMKEQQRYAAASPKPSNDGSKSKSQAAQPASGVTTDNSVTQMLSFGMACAGLARARAHPWARMLAPAFQVSMSSSKEGVIGARWHERRRRRRRMIVAMIVAMISAGKNVRN